MEEIPIKTRQIEYAKRIRPVNLDAIEARFLTVLRRESMKMMERSLTEELTEDSARKLTNYLKLLRDLKADKLKELEMLSDEELAKLAI